MKLPNKEDGRGLTPTLHRLLLDHSYAIVDQARVQTLPEGMTFHPLVPSSLEDSAHLLPVLVDLSELKPEVFSLCLERLVKEKGSDASLFCALLRCEGGVSSLRQALRSALIAWFNGEERHFRYFDPRVFCQLGWVLDPAQYCRVFGNATSWAYPVDGEWNQVSKPETVPALRLCFSAIQADQLECLRTINEVMERMALSRQSDARALAPVSTSPLSTPMPASISMALPQRIESAQQAYALTIAARKHGLQRQGEIALFIEHGLALHPRFYEHAAFSKRLATLNHQLDCPYRHAVMDLSQDDLQRVRRELNRT